MARKRRKSQSMFGRHQSSEVPFYVITSNPKGPENAIGLEKIQISLGLCHEDHLVECIRELHEDGFKNVQYRKMSQMLTDKCPKCKKPGKATISLDRRERSKKWIDRATPILIHYHHGTKKHYIGTWKNGSIHRSPSVDSFESVMRFD